MQLDLQTLDMAGAIVALSKSFGGGGSSTPEHRNQVIALLEEDGDFSDEDEVEVMGLFAGNMAVADTFLGIHKKKVALHLSAPNSVNLNLNLIIVTVLTISSPYICSMLQVFCCILD